MYVCICNGYRDSEIRDVARSGVHCVLEAYRTLGNGPCCGKCLDFAQGLIDAEHAGRSADAQRTPELQLQTIG